MIAVVDVSSRAGGRRYSMSGFLNEREADEYIRLLKGRFIKGTFEYWRSFPESRICTGYHKIKEVTI